MPTGRKQAKSRLEALLSMASGAVAEPVAGLAGLLGLATGGARRGADAVERTRAALTYQPRDPSAMQELGRLVEPVTSRIEQGKRYLGDSAYSATGSPALAAAAYTAPEGLAALLGLRGAGMKGPTMQQMAQRTGELPSMGSPASQIGAINAWHGSPHDFDRFSMDRIGTGEGAQAYGHGLYFAGKPEVAQQYRGQLSEGTFRTSSGEIFDPSTLEHINLRTIARRDGINAAFEKAMEIAQSDSPVAGHAMRDANRLLDVSDAKRNSGSLYEVELAPDETDLLDWDAPLSQQPEKVQAAIDRLGLKPEDYSMPVYYPDGRKEWLSTGSTIYRALARATGGHDGIGLGNSVAASDAMRQAGIPGIRYLDGGSRAAGDGSRNYVMFDDSLVKIKGKE